MFGCSTVSNLNIARLEARAEIVIFQGNVLSVRDKPLRCSHCDAQLVVLVHFTYKRRDLNMHGKNIVDFLEKSYKRDDIAKCLR